jgi:hypothetical protein
MTRDEIKTEIDIERWRQDLKFPGQWARARALGQDGMPDGLKLCILGEEFGEVCKAIIEGQPVEHLKMELVQVAAVCVAWLEGL